MRVSQENFNSLSISLAIFEFEDLNFTKEELDKKYNLLKEKDNSGMIDDAYTFLKNKVKDSKKGTKKFTTEYDKFDIDGALEIIRIKITGKLLGNNTEEELRKRKDELNKKLRDFYLNYETSLDYFSMCNEYNALKSYFDFDDMINKIK